MKNKKQTSRKHGMSKQTKNNKKMDKIYIRKSCSKRTDDMKGYKQSVFILSTPKKS